MKPARPPYWAISLALLILPAPAGADSVHVPGDFADIQTAIDDSNTQAGDEIVVAPGTYLLTAPTDFNGKAITLRGASGNPADTILDGQNNVFHVFQCVSGEDPNTVLSGFTITGGNANGATPDNRGGGMYIAGSSPTVINCVFRENFVDVGGGGMFILSGNPTVTDCLFDDNTAAFGGGLFNDDANPIVTGCTFSDNLAIGNVSGGEGGGMYNSNSSPIVTNCTFFENSTIVIGPNGGDGGGMCNVSNSRPKLAGCRFGHNNAVRSGGAISNDASRPTLASCALVGNSAFRGGALYNVNSSGPVLANCTWTNNSADFGGVMYNNNNCNPAVTNGILWDNGADAIVNYLSTPVVRFSDVQGGYSGAGNINANPLFADADGADNVSGTDDDDLRLLAGSPCIDTGDNSVVASGATDLYGNPRIVNGVVDMGAVESRDCNGDGMDDLLDDDADTVPDVCDVCPGFDDTLDSDADTIPDGCDQCPGFDDLYDSDGDGTPDCPGDPSVHNRTQETDLYDIRQALEQAVDFDLIEVDPGTHLVHQPVDFMGKAVTLRSTSGDPGDTFLDGQNVVFHVVQCISGEGPDTILGGFTITGGNANGSSSNGNGGGMYNSGAGLTLRHCVFNDNSAKTNGGGMYNTSSSNPTILFCTFSANTAGMQGNAIFNANSSPTVMHSIFRDNTGGNYGGAIYNVGSSPMLTGCLFSGNATGVDGGAFAKAGGSPMLMQCTFTANTADSGGGIANLSGSLIIINSVFWNNAPDQISGSAAISFSNMQGGLPAGVTDGGGNIDGDPLFVDSNNGDYRLQPASPCIDAGDTSALPADTLDLDDDSNTTEPIPFDLAGRIRLVDDLDTIDTGISGPPVVDIGAYEFQGCAGNLDAISGVALGDVALLANHWMQTDCGPCGGADFDNDHNVGMSDLMVQLTNWLCTAN